MYLKKEDALFERDEEKKLLPIERTLRVLEKKEGDKIIKEAPKIKFYPIPRGKWLKMIEMKDEEQDKVMLEEHLIEPKITYEEYVMAQKPMVMTAIVNAIVAATLDISQEPVANATRKELTEVEEWALEKKKEIPNNESSSSSTNKDTPSLT